MKQKLIDFYLDFFNNYLTIAKFSESNGLGEGMTLDLLEIGRKLHEENAERLKTIKN